MESLDRRIQDRVLEKVAYELNLQGRVFISIDFVSKCNHILVFKTTFSFNGRSCQEQFNFNLCEEGFFNTAGMLF